MLQSDYLASVRKKRLRLLSLELVIVIVLFWVTFPWYVDYPGTNYHWIEGRTTTFVLSVVGSLVIFALSYFLYRGHRWAWWGTLFLLVELPAFFALTIFFPFVGGLLCIILFNGLFECNVLESFIPNTLPQEIDALAAAMHIQWEEQPLWNLVSLAKQGKIDEAVKTLRQTQHMTWDQADQTIRRWMCDELALKVHLLKTHVQDSLKPDHIHLPV